MSNRRRQNLPAGRQVYNYALTATQVKTLYNNGVVSFNLIISSSVKNSTLGDL